MITLAVAGAGSVLVWRVHADLIAGLDNALTQRVHDVAAEASSGQLSALPATGADSAVLVQVLDARGRLLASSANIDGEPALFHGYASRRTIGVRSVSGIPGSDPGTHRLASATASTPAGAVTIYAARSVSDVTRGIDDLVAALLIGAPFLIAALGVVVWALVGRALRPVEAMRSAVDSMPGDQPHRRLVAEPAAEELQRLADTFNQLLHRIEDSAAQQRRFLADAAHELRNPVASMLTRLEIRDPNTHVSASDRALLRTDAIRLASLVDSLLSLARLDARIAMRANPVDLDDVIFEHAQTLTGHGHRIDVSRVSAAQVTGDRLALGRVVRNLLDNADGHASDTVTIELSDDGHTVTLILADDGSGIPAADRDRVFERFTRLDEARDREHGGAGLGLAIVREIVDRHNGSIRIEDNRPGTRFVVSFPSPDRNQKL